MHREFITESLIDRLREELQREYPQEFQERHRDIRRKSKLKIFQEEHDPRASEDKCSIDFEPKTIAELDSFHLFLTQEARLRNIFS
jgi:hypothetical protein